MLYRPRPGYRSVLRGEELRRAQLEKALKELDCDVLIVTRLV
jgi:hypothetical protein